MKATVFNKLQNLLHMGMKGKDRDSIRYAANTYYLTPDHVAYIRIREDTRLTSMFFKGKEEASFEIPKAFCIDAEVCVRRDYLLETLKNMDSDNVMISASTDRSLIIQGKTGDSEVDVWIAPRIENE